MQATVRLGTNVETAFIEQFLEQQLPSTISSRDMRHRHYAAYVAWLPEGSAPAFEPPARESSGGERTKVGLVSISTRAPPCLLLDEPTNHLEIVGKRRSKKHCDRILARWIAVSHDRAFLQAWEKRGESHRLPFLPAASAKAGVLYAATGQMVDVAGRFSRSRIRPSRSY